MALVNNFGMTKKFPITKFDCISIIFGTVSPLFMIFINQLFFLQKSKFTFQA